MMLRIILNWDNKEKQYKLIKPLKELNYEAVQYSLEGFNPMLFSSLRGKLLLFYKYYKGSLKAVKESKKNDFLIGTNFHVGAIISILSWIFRKPNKILAFNLILNDKSKLVNFLRGVFLWLAFKNKNFYCTINDDALIHKYSNYFLGKISSKRFLVLTDLYENSLGLKSTKENEGYVFCGGENSRDWNTLFEAAKKLQDIKFVCVARRRLFFELSVPENVELIFDISFENFIDLVRKSKLVALPILSEGPAGLLVLFDATSLGKPIITTETAIVKKYLKNNNYGTLIPFHNVDALANGIQNIFEDYHKALEKSTHLKKFLLEEHSLDSYAKKLHYIIQEIYD